MDFPHVEEKTQERFTRLWPKHEQNETLKALAKDAPSMIKFSREGEGPHFKLYESRIPSGFNADENFGSFTTDEAKRASLAERASFVAGKQTAEKVGSSTSKPTAAEEKYPESVRYYPAMSEGNRDRFNEIADRIATERGVKRKEIVRYPLNSPIKAYVSEIGPIAELAEWQTDAAKALWRSDYEKLQRERGESQSRNQDKASDVVERQAPLQAEGKTFLAEHGKGLQLPPQKEPERRAAVLAQVASASMEDLKKVQQASETEFKALERKLYGRQITAAQEKDKSLTKEGFNKLSPEDRRKVGGDGLTNDEFRRMVRTKNGFFAINRELNGRGEHLTLNQARDLKNQEPEKEQAKPVDEKGASRKPAPEPEREAEAPRQGRASSKGAAAAAALAGQLGR